VKEFPVVNSRGGIVNDLRVQFNGEGRFFPLKELPADGVFKLVGMLILLLVGQALRLPAQTVQTNTVTVRQQQQLNPPNGATVYANVAAGGTLTNNAALSVLNGGTVTCQMTLYGWNTSSTNTVTSQFQISNDKSNWVNLATMSLTANGPGIVTAISNFYVAAANYAQVSTTTNAASGVATNIPVQITTYSKNN